MMTNDGHRMSDPAAAGGVCRMEVLPTYQLTPTPRNKSLNMKHTSKAYSAEQFKPKDYTR